MACNGQLRPAGRVGHPRAAPTPPFASQAAREPPLRAARTAAHGSAAAGAEGCEGLTAALRATAAWRATERVDGILDREGESLSHAGWQGWQERRATPATTAAGAFGEVSSPRQLTRALAPMGARLPCHGQPGMAPRTSTAWHASSHGKPLVRPGRSTRSSKRTSQAVVPWAWRRRGCAAATAQAAPGRQKSGGYCGWWAAPLPLPSLPEATRSPGNHGGCQSGVAAKAAWPDALPPPTPPRP